MEEKVETNEANKTETNLSESEDKSKVVKRKKTTKKKLVNEAESANVETLADEKDSKEAEPTKEKEIVAEVETNKSSSRKLTQLEKIMICIIVVLSTFLVIMLSKQPKAKVMLSDFNEIFVDTNASITLDNGWYHTNSGDFLAYEDGLLEYKGTIQSVEADESEANSYLSSLMISYGATTLEDYKYTCYILSQEYDDQEYTYYFIFENNVITQLVLIDVEEDIANKILSSLVLE